MLHCCSTVLVSVLAPFCFPRSALSLSLLLLVVLVLHVARFGLGGGGDHHEQHEEDRDQDDEGSGQKARHLTLPQLDGAWKLDQGLEVIPPSVALPSCSELPLLDASSSGNPLLDGSSQRESRR